MNMLCRVVMCCAALHCAVLGWAGLGWAVCYSHNGWTILIIWMLNIRPMHTLSVSVSCSLTYSHVMGVTIWYTVGTGKLR